MKNSDLFASLKYVFTLLVLVSLTAACSNSTSPDDHDHGDAEGFRLVMNGNTIVEQLPERSLTGKFELTPGQETDLISVHFIDHDGVEFQPEEDSFSLGYEFDDEGIVEFEQHEEDGKWSFHLHAQATDTTNLRLKLMHSGHSDFTSQNIPIHVQPAQ